MFVVHTRALFQLSGCPRRFSRNPGPNGRVLNRILNKFCQIRDSYPEKNKHEAKVKKEYGNKAYQEGKDLDALFLYTQVGYSS